MEEWKQKLEDIAETMDADKEYAMRCILWCVGTLNVFWEQGLVSDGEYTLSENGKAIYDGLKTTFEPTDADIATAVVGLVAEEDQEDMALLLSTYRDHGDSMLDDFKKYSEAYKYN